MYMSICVHVCVSLNELADKLCTYVKGIFGILVTYEKRQEHPILF